MNFETISPHLIDEQYLKFHLVYLCFLIIVSLEW